MEFISALFPGDESHQRYIVVRRPEAEPVTEQAPY